MLDRLIAKSPFATAVSAALDESRRRGDRRLGTEHLLLGLLHGDDVVQALGVTLDDARAALDGLDRDALTALGIDVEGLRPPAVAVKRGPLTLGALTSAARSAVNEVTKKREPLDLLRVLLRRTRPDPAADLLDALGVDRESVLRHLDGKGDVPLSGSGGRAE